MKTLLFRYKYFIALFLLSQFLCAGLANAQSRIVNTIAYESGNATSGYGRDFWFAIPQNYRGSAQKYFQVYVSAQRNTTIYFQVAGGPLIKKPVTAAQVTIFKTPTPKAPGGDFSLTGPLNLL